jgi:uncharacterized protein YjbI with pentapeptide repeats
MRSADFGNATMTDVVFEDCELEGAVFSGARLRGVSLTGSKLAGMTGIVNLRGATMTLDQLIDIAPGLAAELGIVLEQ